MSGKKRYEVFKLKARIGRLEFEVNSEKDLELLFSIRKKISIPQKTVEVPKEEFDKEAFDKEIYGHRHRKHKSFKKRQSRKFKHWTKEELEIIRNNPPKKAKKLLAGRTISAIYVQRKAIGITEPRKVSASGTVKTVEFVDKSKKETKQARVILEMQKPEFDMFSKREDKEEANNLYLAVLEHSSRKKKPISIAEVCSLFALNATEARALLLDTWQQQKKIFVWLNIQDRSMTLTSDNTLEFK